MQYNCFLFVNAIYMNTRLRAVELLNMLSNFGGGGWARRLRRNTCKMFDHRTEIYKNVHNNFALG